ncbi:MAG TPA: hypothetical protein IGS52_17440 [Oscillatoriaceae cyanobacterium M33_DOE_052]|nr:hypothetical protein [Oscillatoriaceae cyanobacterium M33_DOE_052]
MNEFRYNKRKVSSDSGHNHALGNLAIDSTVTCFKATNGCKQCWLKAAGVPAGAKGVDQP